MQSISPVEIIFGQMKIPNDAFGNVSTVRGFNSLDCSDPAHVFSLKRIQYDDVALKSEPFQKMFILTFQSAAIRSFHSRPFSEKLKNRRSLPSSLCHGSVTVLYSYLCLFLIKSTLFN